MSPAAPSHSVVIMMTRTTTTMTTQTTQQTTQQTTEYQSATPPRAPRFARARNLPLAVVVRVLLTVLAMSGASFGAAIGAAAALGPLAGGPAGSMAIFALVCVTGTLGAWMLRRFFEGDRCGHLAAGFHGGMHIVNRPLSIWVPEGQDQTSVAVLGVTMGMVFVACRLLERRLVPRVGPCPVGVADGD